MTKSAEELAREWIKSRGGPYVKLQTTVFAEDPNPQLMPKPELIDAFLAGFKAGVEEAQRWISYEDQKPVDGQIVLIPCRIGSIPAEYNNPKGGKPFWVLWDCPGSVNPERIVHLITRWTSLPPPPAEKEKL